MASTTTNYGFDVPTSSDLVKNGATQIALLGQDLDTFLFRPFTRNGVLNSGMQVAQRGTTFTSITSATYTLDRWQGFRGAGAAYNVSQQATNDTTNLPFITSCARVGRPSGNTSTQAVFYVQTFESVNSRPYAGRTVTLSFYARAGANFSATSNLLGCELVTGTGTDQNVLTGFTGGASAFSQNNTLTTTWQRFTVTGAVTGASTQLGLNFYYTPTGTAGANDYFEVTGVQLEVGNQASPYAPATPTYATELAVCQRYYQTYNGFTAFGDSTTALLGTIGFPQMRTAPSVAAGGVFTVSNPGVADYTQSTAQVSIISTRVANNALTFSMTNFTGLTARQVYPQFVNSIGSGSPQILLSAEL